MRSWSSWKGTLHSTTCGAFASRRTTRVKICRKERVRDIHDLTNDDKLGARLWISHLIRNGQVVKDRPLLNQECRLWTLKHGKISRTFFFNYSIKQPNSRLNKYVWAYGYSLRECGPSGGKVNAVQMQANPYLSLI